MYELVVIGNPSFDRFASKRNNGHRALSGPAAYSIVTASKLGLENVAIVGAVGDDYEVKFKNTMHELGVPEFFTLDSKDTGGLELEETAAGEFALQRCITEGKKIGVRDVPDEFLSSKMILLSPMLQEIDAEFIQWICNSSDAHIYLDPQIVRSKDNGVLVPVKDVEAFEKTQCFLDGIQMNRHEASFFTGESDPFVAAELLVDMLAENCILTLGPDGCLVYDGNDFTSVSAYPVEPIDTYCAGAVHIAGFLASAINGESTDSCISTGTALASIKTENPGMDYTLVTSELDHRRSYVAESIQHR
jgi:sugar/nucleoside kinase (ribokinase family)